MDNDTHDGPCPNCGHCRHCGRSNAPQFVPYNPYPYLPYPAYPSPWWGVVPPNPWYVATVTGPSFGTGTYTTAGTTITHTA